MKSTFSGSIIDRAMWLWFQRARLANIPISGPILQMKAMHYSQELNVDDFKASNGWLLRFKDHHNISARTLSGECAEVDSVTVGEWLSKVPDIVRGYSPRGKCS